MREIKFRGKRTDNGVWIYGSSHNEAVEYETQYFKDGANNHQLSMGLRPVIEVDDDSDCERLLNYAVIPETVGQYAGLKDKNSKEIYEGDILRKGDCFIGYVKYCAPSFYRVPLDKWSIDHGVGETVVNCGTFVTSEIIGNIHDNPELLQKKSPPATANSVGD